MDVGVLVEDLIQTAQKLKLSYEEQLLKDWIQTFATIFFSRKNYLQIRIARKNGQYQLNWRSEYYEKGMNSTSILEFIGNQSLYNHLQVGTSLEFSLIQSLAAGFPTASIAVDFDITKGFVKLWHFGKHTVGDLASLPNAPPALRSLLPVFAENSLQKVFCTGVDMEKRSCNVYFSWDEQKGRDLEDVQQILSNLNMPKPAEEILKCCAHAGSFAVTLRWDSEDVERVCFYIPFVEGAGRTYFEDEESLVKFVKEHKLPTRVKKMAGSFLGCSVGRKKDGGLDFYTKLETDYQRSYFAFLSHLVDYYDEKPEQ